MAKFLLAFIVIYLASTFFIVPLLSKLGNRSPLPISGHLRPLTLWTIVLNRHYVNSDLKITALNVAKQVSDKFPGSKMNYLDANFPFFDGFPLPPHLSHNDGKKLDLAFCYFDGDERSNLTPSFIGYGAYENPRNGEVNYPEECRRQGYWQYGFIGRFVPKWNASDYTIDAERTRLVIRKFSDEPSVSKIFIEPHLKERWGFSKNAKVRFHGCQAVRHDDHIHLQVR
ncbi:MAG: hypothetical protein ABJG47_06335 [Ekhidna sp.]